MFLAFSTQAADHYYLNKTTKKLFISLISNKNGNKLLEEENNHFLSPEQTPASNDLESSQHSVRDLLAIIKKQNEKIKNLITHLTKLKQLVRD